MGEPASNEIILQVSAKRGRGKFLETILQSGHEWIELTTLAVNAGLTGSFIGLEMAGAANRINDQTRRSLGGINPLEFSLDQAGMQAGMIRINPRVEITCEGEGNRSDWLQYKIKKKS